MPGIGTEARVFPTCVGVFLAVAVFLSAAFSLPHVRGGVSIKTVDIMAVK